MTDITVKQYMLSSRRHPMPSMRELTVSCGFLYVHPSLPCECITAANGEPLYLLGHAFCMDEVGNTPAADIATWDGEDLITLTQYWTGRWALLYRDRLITDACGLMAAFYHNDIDGWFVSSSLAVLCRETHTAPSHPVSSTGLNWRLLPRTRADGIALPLCTQRLVLTDTVSVEPHLWMADHRTLATEQQCELLGKYLVNGVSNIHRFSEKQLHVALTGGKDSRLVLAALLKADVPFRAYTALHDTISTADRRTPKQLAKQFGFQHITIPAKSTDPQRLADHDAFTAENTNGTDRQFFARGQFDAFDESTLILRGGLFEAGQTYARSYTGNTPDAFEAGMRRYYTALTTDTAQSSALGEWLDTVRLAPTPAVDIRDRFYLEQRAGGWVAAIEQSLDLLPFTSVQLANCSALLSVLLSADEDARKTCALNLETIRLLQPSLLEYDINKRSLSDRLRFWLTVAKHPVKKFRAWMARR